MRSWSWKTLKMMAGMLQINLNYREVCGLNDTLHEQLGDWLYYQSNPLEKDPLRFRPIPDLIQRTKLSKGQRL